MRVAPIRCAIPHLTRLLAACRLTPTCPKCSSRPERSPSVTTALPAPKRLDPSDISRSPDHSATSARWCFPLVTRRPSCLSKIEGDDSASGEPSAGCWARPAYVDSHVFKECRGLSKSAADVVVGLGETWASPPAAATARSFGGDGSPGMMGRFFRCKMNSILAAAAE